MRFTTVEFLHFARVSQDSDWVTASQRKLYTYQVETGGIRVIPSTGTGRLITNSMVNKFCQLFGDPSDLAKSELKNEFNNSYLLPIAQAFDPNLSQQPLAEEIVDSVSLREGATRLVSINAYERNPEARRLCIEAHGTSCSVCGFSFEAVYGEAAAGFIHVHHLFPLALRAAEHEVNPRNDLRPVCPNCHAVIHLAGGCLSIAEAKALLRLQA